MSAPGRGRGGAAAGPGNGGAAEAAGGKNVSNRGHAGAAPEAAASPPASPVGSGAAAATAGEPSAAPAKPPGPPPGVVEMDGNSNSNSNGNSVTGSKANNQSVREGNCPDLLSKQVFEQRFEEVKKFLKNGLYYQSINNAPGALVSYSNAETYVHFMIQLFTHAKTKTDHTPEVKQIEQYISFLSKLEQQLLGYIEVLQEKTKALMRSGGSKKEEKEEWQEICQTVDTTSFTGEVITFSDLIGMYREKDLIKTSFIKPLLLPNLFPALSKGILLFGPPGTGKTYLAKAAITELQGVDPSIGVIFITPTGADLKGKYVGETEKRITKFFTCAARAACVAQEKSVAAGKPKKYVSILFIDEFDSVAGDRLTDDTGLMANSVNTILQMMDGVNSFKNVAVIAATNYPWKLDAAVLRRFTNQIMINIPNAVDTLELIRYSFKQNIKIKEFNYFCYCKDNIKESVYKAQPNSLDAVCAKSYTENEYVTYKDGNLDFSFPVREGEVVLGVNYNNSYDENTNITRLLVVLQKQDSAGKTFSERYDFKVKGQLEFNSVNQAGITVQSKETVIRDRIASLFASAATTPGGKALVDELMDIESKLLNSSLTEKKKIAYGQQRYKLNILIQQLEAFKKDNTVVNWLKKGDPEATPYIQAAEKAVSELLVDHKGDADNDFSRFIMNIQSAIFDRIKVVVPQKGKPTLLEQLVEIYKHEFNRILDRIENKYFDVIIDKYYNKSSAPRVNLVIILNSYIGEEKNPTDYRDKVEKFKNLYTRLYDFTRSTRASIDTQNMNSEIWTLLLNNYNTLITLEEEIEKETAEIIDILKPKGGDVGEGGDAAAANENRGVAHSTSVQTNPSIVGLKQRRVQVAAGAGGKPPANDVDPRHGTKPVPISSGAVNPVTGLAWGTPLDQLVRGNLFGGGRRKTPRSKKARRTTKRLSR
jgi:hypothetical protein